MGHWIIDKVLAENRLKRIALGVPNFLGVALIVANTDLVVTVPLLFGDVLVGTSDIKNDGALINFQPYAVKQHWHECYHHDPRSQWLRSVVATCFSTLRKAKTGEHVAQTSGFGVFLTRKPTAASGRQATIGRHAGFPPEADLGARLAAHGAPGERATAGGPSSPEDSCQLSRTDRTWPPTSRRAA